MRFAATTIGGLDRLPAGLIGINGFYPGLGGIRREPHFPAKRQKQAPLGVYLEEEPLRSVVAPAGPRKTERSISCGSSTIAQARREQISLLSSSQIPWDRR